MLGLNQTENFAEPNIEEQVCNNACLESSKCGNNSEEFYYCADCGSLMHNLNELSKEDSVKVFSSIITMFKDSLDKYKFFVERDQFEPTSKPDVENQNLPPTQFDTIQREYDSILEHFIKVQQMYDIKELNKYTINESKILTAQTLKNTALINHEHPQTDNLNFEETKEEIFKMREDEEVKRTEEEKYSESQNTSFSQDNLPNINQSDSDSQLNSPQSQIELVNVDAIFQKYFGEFVKINSDSEIVFYLNEDRWRDLLEELKETKFPEVKKIKLEYIPEDLFSIKKFMISSLQRQKKLNFNCSKQVQISASIYIDSLKVAASKTSDVFRVNFTDLSTQDFRGLIIAARNTKKVMFRYCTLAIDSQRDFGDALQNSKIEKIDFGSSGGKSFSDWTLYPQRFENIISSISSCPSLSASLKILCLNGCGISRDTAQGVLNKFGLNHIELKGV